MKIFVLALAFVSPFTMAANWQLDNSQSSLHFVSVKNDTVAEVHQFKQLSGNWDGAKVNISIAADSLDTQIPIRNERIWQYVLKSSDYAAITVRAELNEQNIKTLSVGGSTVQEIPLNVTISGTTATVNSKVRITRLSSTALQANTEAPLMLSTSSFKLTDGVAKLQELAGLKRIDPIVPVSFSVRFTQ
mgnify:CR=1 FL=1